MQKIKHITAAVVALIAATAMLSGCSSQRSAQTSATGGVGTATIPAAIAAQTPQQRYTALCESYGEWDDVTVPVKVTLTSPKSMSVSARAVMKRNHWISLSMRMFGFEVASAWIDNDSVHVVDRYHKNYLSESTAKAFGSVGLKVSDLQDMLLGRGFMLGSDGGTFTTAMSDKLLLQPTDNTLVIRPAASASTSTSKATTAATTTSTSKTNSSTSKTNTASANTAGDFEYGFILSPDYNRVAAMSVIAGSNEAVVSYGEWISTTTSGDFATEVDVTVSANLSAAATFTWSFSSAKWNTGVTKAWETPSGYTRLEAAKLLKALTAN